MLDHRRLDLLVQWYKILCCATTVSSTSNFYEIHLLLRPHPMVKLAAAVAAQTPQLGIPITPSSFPNIPPDNTPKVEAPKTDFAAIEAALLSSGPDSLSKTTHAIASQPDADPDPATPDSFNFVFGPTNGATGAPGFMGFTLIDDYNVETCAQLCKSRDPDASGGACQFFNIWLAIENGTATQTTCAFYFLPTDISTATNLGTDQLQVSESRGYARITLIPDGGFEGFTCVCCPGHPFCSTTSYAAWTVLTDSVAGSPTEILRLTGTHTGFVFATLGFFSAGNPGLLAPTAQPLATIAGKVYVITLFLRVIGVASDGVTPATGFGVMWNGAVVFTPKAVENNWNFYQVQVTAIGNDQVVFKDDRDNQGLSSSELDDVFLFLA
ncbi:hypothetical protein BDZ97DRAFT_1032046 [Flammula alnicola]|nr:hypothetical protein BDZ97DRAFT_1032046 [Flammula alnicola]